MDHSNTSSQSHHVKPIRAKIAAMTFPIAVVVALSIFFGILFLPFGIVFAIVALGVIGFQVLRNEAVDEG